MSIKRLFHHKDLLVISYLDTARLRNHVWCVVSVSLEVGTLGWGTQWMREDPTWCQGCHISPFPSPKNMREGSSNFKNFSVFWSQTICCSVGLNSVLVPSPSGSNFGQQWHSGPQDKDSCGWSQHCCASLNLTCRLILLIQSLFSVTHTFTSVNFLVVCSF